MAITTIPKWGQIQNKPALVNSLNGQSGAIVNTVAYAIGSYVLGRPSNYTNYSPGQTVAGSALYAVTGGAVYTEGAWHAQYGATRVNVGTWRCVSPAWGDGTTTSPGLWVREA